MTRKQAKQQIKESPHLQGARVVSRTELQRNSQKLLERCSKSGKPLFIFSRFKPPVVAIGVNTLIGKLAQANA